MPSPDKIPLSFNRDRAVRQLDARLEELLEKLRKNRPSEDPWMVRRAYEIATERHHDQFRSSGDPYLSHLLEVAHILADMRLDATSLPAAILHDAIEDTEYPISRIEERFGVEVARLVEGVTKIGRLKMMAPEARQAENVRKMLLAMVNDVRVVLVKLADRLHNMRTLEYLEPEKQHRISRETLDIYAPIALRLGMGVVRGELEDLAFRYLEPEAFFALQKEISDKAPSHKEFLEEVQATIQTRLVEAGIPAELESRIKGLYSVHRKLIRQEIGLGQVYDLLAVRVITDSERNCYAALGVVHHIWRPVPGRFKDYIAIARPNLYQSLHTTVLHSGQPFEVQIRTQEMHRIAEEGVAAHWKYKDGKPMQEDDQRITWMRQLIEWSQELEEPGEFLSTLKVDLAPVEVYAFTPKGRVLDLPRGAADSGLSKIEDLYAAVGFGKYSARQVLTRVLGDAAKAAEPPAEDAKPTLVKTVKRMLGFGEAPLIVKGYDDLLVYRAKCCNPIPGDDIIGYITRGRGVAAHTRPCPNLPNLLYQPQRRIAVEWGGAGAVTFQVQLMIRARDRAGLLADITAVITGAGSNIDSLESRPDRSNARIDASLEIADRRQLETIVANIRKVSGVYGVERVFQV